MIDPYLLNEDGLKETMMMQGEHKGFVIPEAPSMEVSLVNIATLEDYALSNTCLYVQSGEWGT
jgi:hypothetical protein